MTFSLEWLRVGAREPRGIDVGSLCHSAIPSKASARKQTLLSQEANASRECCRDYGAYAHFR